MKNISCILLLLPMFLFSQTEKKETVYLLFDIKSNETCTIEVEQTRDNKQAIEVVNKFRKKIKGNTINRFYICDEIFRLRGKTAIDTFKTKMLEKITFRDIAYLNARRDELKAIHFFKNSVFEDIYLIEPHKDYMIQYRVIWVTDLIQR